jgi:ubiquinone/menaquinone biosynthesis C-methylase UbiE
MPLPRQNRTIMRRIPEPELMDDARQARAYAGADFEEPNQLFVHTFARLFPAYPGDGVLLDLGCGPGDIALRFARRYPRSRVIAVDGAAAMLEHARLAVARAGLGERIRLLQARIGAAHTLAGLAPASVQGVISNSLLHHLAEPMDLWRTIQRLAVSGAPVMVMDLRRPASQILARQLVRQYAADEPEILRHDFYHSLCAAYTPEEVEQQLAIAGLGYFQVQAVSDRHWVASGSMA